METIFIGLKKRNKKIFLYILVCLSIGCVTTKQISIDKNKLKGEYILQSNKLYQALSDMNYHSLILNENGTYILNKAKIKFSPVIEQCEIASKGKWSVLSNDVLELTSEDVYLKQKGFEYELKKENKLSQDSLYIKVDFPEDANELPITLNFGFNDNNSRSLVTNKRFIVIPKSKYLMAKSSNSVNRNNIAFYITGNISCKQRTVFKIFEEDIDTENTNYLTITLPNFDRCFFEFEPLNKDLLYIKNSSQLVWKGDTWKK